MPPSNHRYIPQHEYLAVGPGSPAPPASPAPSMINSPKRKPVRGGSGSQALGLTGMSISSSSGVVGPRLPKRNESTDSLVQLNPGSGIGGPSRSTTPVGQGGYTDLPSYRDAPPTPTTAQSASWDVERQRLGGAYGPYSYENQTHARTPSTGTISFTNEKLLPPLSSRTALLSSAPSSSDKLPPPLPYGLPPSYFQDDEDDELHNPAKLSQPFTCFSLRGWANAITLLIIAAGILTLFPGFFIYQALSTRGTHSRASTIFGPGGINSTGQVPKFPSSTRFVLVDPDTPTTDDVTKRTDASGNSYSLIFSDEFNQDGRTFWPGDDPFWEAQDFHYWPTGDLEWYDPQAITTKDGNMVITLSKMENHDLQYQSGMVTGWNKFCFTTGYVEVRISLPGSGQVPGFWPGAWTMGNLGRAGYGASTDGMWPYTYDACDVGTFPDQITKYDSTTGALPAPSSSYQSQLSGLPGQRLSACTCPKSDHPGPVLSTNTPSSSGSTTDGTITGTSSFRGRGVPEIDIIEAQVDATKKQGQVSQSFQVAPFDAGLVYNTTNSDFVVYYDEDITGPNSFSGTNLQQSVSGVTYIDNSNYNGTNFAVYGYEWWSAGPAVNKNPTMSGDKLESLRSQSYITWYSEGKPSWTLNADAIGPNNDSLVSRRIIPEEPMYLILNLGFSPSFEAPDLAHLQFPAEMYIDYVRVYQRDDVVDQGFGATCDPPGYPTEQYISDHITAYTNWNLTTWSNASYDVPRNALYDGC